MKNKKDLIYSLIALAVIAVLLLVTDMFFDSYTKRILNQCAIYAMIAISMNLVIGFTGLFTLGQAGFMAVGAYTTALLTLPVSTKDMIFHLEPLVAPFNAIELPFPVGLLLGGVVAVAVAFLIGAPALRLRGDYLAIATLGFSEIIRLIFTNTNSLTNGALGLKGIPNNVNIWWSFGALAITILASFLLINSSYGRALKAIREDETAAQAMGINLFQHKILSFCFSAFFAGIGGGMLGSLIGTIDPLMFRFEQTFNILLIVVLGGIGSITGTVIAAFVITIAKEWLRFLDESMFGLPAMPGMRMVVFSALLVVCVLFFRSGIMGTREFSWDGLFRLLRIKRKAATTEEGGEQA